MYIACLQYLSTHRRLPLVVDGRVTTSLLVALVLIAGLVVADRAGRLLLALVSLLTALAGGRVLAVLAVRADYRDADGFVDCWPYCSTFQDAVAAVLFFGPLAAVLLLAFAALLVALRQRRSSRR